jgi:hypothetical protein
MISILLHLLISLPYNYPVVVSEGKCLEDFVPTGYHILAQTKGNLNRDTMTDIAAILESDVYIEDLKETDHKQKARIFIIIFATSNGGYKLSTQSNDCTMLSDDGGMLGDPFQELYVENKTVCIDYYGGSTDRWAYTYKWRFQQKGWFLIGATYKSMSPHDNLIEKYDFNLNTGIAEFTVMPYLKSDNPTKDIKPSTKRYNVGKKPLFSLQGFRFGENMVYKDIYF